MSEINKLAVKITGDESGLKKATKAAQKDIQSVSKAALSVGDIIKGSAIGGAIGSMVANMAGAISGLASIGTHQTCKCLKNQKKSEDNIDS